MAALKHELEVAKKEALKEKRRAEKLEQLVGDLDVKGEGSAVEKEERLSTQKLIARVAELEANQMESSSSQEKEHIETLEKELEALRRAQKEEEHMNEVITKQRDMYKELLAERDTMVLEQSKPEQSFQATHTQLVQHAKETMLQLQTVRNTLQKKVDSLQRQLIEKTAELDHAKHETELEQKSAAQAREALDHQQSLVASLELQARQMSQEACELQRLLAVKQKEVDTEREKVKVRGEYSV